MSLRSGSLFTGYGGLLLAAEDALGTSPLWCSEHEPPSTRTPKPTQAAARILAHRFPGLPNLGDIQTVDWSQVDEVDAVEGGYPRPGESAAGKRLGMDDPRWMWPSYFRLIREMRPRIAIGENVRGHLTRSFRYVVADLQSIGYAVCWTLIAASEVGACHERMRLLWVAYDEQAGAPTELSAAPVALLVDGDWQVPGLFGAERLDKMPKAGAAYAGAAYAGAAPGSSLPLLRTPTAQLAINGGSQHPDKRKAGGHGPTLADEVEHLLPTPTARSHGTNRSGSSAAATRPTLNSLAKLLPTPTTQDAANLGAASQQSRNSPPLNALAARLMATPTAAIAQGGPPQDSKGKRDLRLDLTLLPTPKATDGSKGGPNQRGSSGDLMLPSAVQPERFGVFAEAVARWEALTRPAPDAAVASPRGGWRLNPYFVEWMMDAPEGWVVDVPGVTRNEALRACGNGVVRRQGAAAIALLTARIPAAVLRRSEAA